MQGKRIYLDANGVLPPMNPGDYGKDREGRWWAICPHKDPGLFPLLARLDSHEITEHEDGSITVSPSILLEREYAGVSWHGFLERGVWREV